MGGCFDLLTSILAYANLRSSFATLPEYVLKAGSSGHCGDSVTASSAYVKSHDGAGLFGGLASYAANQDCEITYSAGAGKQILIKFTFFDLQPPVGDVCLDRVQITELEEQATTGTLAATTAAMTTMSNVTSETLNATESNVTSVTTDVTTVTTAPATMETTATDAATTNVQTTADNYTEPSGVNATFWNTTEVCNTTQANETICWNVTTSYVVFIPHTEATTEESTVGPGVTVTCVSLGTYVSNSSSVNIRFVSDASIQRAGFLLLLTSFRSGTCTASEFSCDTDRCISNTLKCDGVSHCVDGADETTFHAGCPALVAGGFSQYAILGIAIVAVGVVLTTIAIILVWTYLGKSEAPRKRRGDVEDQEELQTTSKETPIFQLQKSKKTVTIEAGEKKAARPVEPPKPRGPLKRKVEPVVAADVEW